MNVDERIVVTKLKEKFNIRDCFVKLHPIEKIDFKDCFVQLNPIDKEVYSKNKLKMETPTNVKRKPGRKPNSANTSTPALSSKATSAATTPAEATKTPASDKPAKKYNKRTPVQPVVNENVGRGKRTPKPNPRYMDDTVVSTTKVAAKEDSADSESDGEPEEGFTSDEYHGQIDAMKKRKFPSKSLPVKITSLKKGTPNAGKPSVAAKKGSASVPVKRRYAEIDINIDDERGKQLFLDAKRRLTHSPVSDDEFETRRFSPKDGRSDALAAKLLAKFGNMPAKKNNNVRTALDRANNANRAKTNAKPLDKETSNNKSLRKNDDLEDFEQMPTFTIVNINDIMDQKGESVEIQKRKPADKGDNDEQADNEDVKRLSVSDTDTPNKGSSKRKTQHTKILSDEKLIKSEKAATPAGPTVNKAKSQTETKMYPVKTPSPKTFQTTAHLSKINNNGRFRDGTSNKPAILRAPPPRILNSTLCKPSSQKTVPSLITKLVPRANTKDKQNNNTILARSKENNVTSYTYTERDGKLIPKKYPTTQPKPNPIPFARSATTLSGTQRIIGHNTGQKCIKKITCFETWYVIKTAEDEKKREIPKITMNLMDLGNNIKKVALPSDDWDYKIVLEKLPNSVILKRQAELAKEKTKALSESKLKKSSVSMAGKKETTEASDSTKPETESKSFSDEATEATSASSSTTDFKYDDSEASTSNANKWAGKKLTKQEESIDSNDSSQPDSSTPEPCENSTENDSESEQEVKSDVYVGEVQDIKIDLDERHNYKPALITFRRKKRNPKTQIQFDRSIIFKNSSFIINVDGRNIKLIAAPLVLNHYEDIEILLQIINDISIKSPCIELATHSL